MQKKQNKFLQPIKIFLPAWFKWFLRRAYYKFLLLVKFRIFKLFEYISLETTTVCNRHCSYCPNSLYGKGKKLMSEDLFRSIIDQLEKMNYFGAVSPNLYGEPLLDIRLPQLIKYARKKLPYCTIRIFTNGDFLTSEVFKELVDSGADEFFVTRHGSGLTKDLRCLLKNPFSSQRIVYFIYPRFLVNKGGLVMINQTKKVKKCLKPAEGLTVDYQGNVILCCNDYFSTVKFGNLEKTRVVDIWRQKKYRRIRKDIKKGVINLEICKKCAAQADMNGIMV